MRKVFYHILLSSLLIICFSCHQKQADLLTCALFIAEDNRPELEKVLEHYKQDIKTISTDWVIEQIDLALHTWQENVYTRNRSLKTSCNFVLSYRFENKIFLGDCLWIMKDPDVGIVKCNLQDYLKD